MCHLIDVLTRSTIYVFVEYLTFPGRLTNARWYENIKPLGNPGLLCKVWWVVLQYSFWEKKGLILLELSPSSLEGETTTFENPEVLLSPSLLNKEYRVIEHWLSYYP